MTIKFTPFILQESPALEGIKYGTGKLVGIMPHISVDYSHHIFFYNLHAKAPGSLNVQFHRSRTFLFVPCKQ